jgi:predicted acylesterase/phospholipase RssA
MTISDDDPLAAPDAPDEEPAPIVPDLASAERDEAGEPTRVLQMRTAAAVEPAPQQPPRGPLGNLALSFSGGGYRAAGFHLGVLSLLDRVGLLPSVTALSTVSGGTIIGAPWVVSLLKKQPFAEFAAWFGNFLRRTNVIGQALDHLTHTRTESASPSLIRSAAAVYAGDGFLGQRPFGDVLNAEDLPLDEVIFNTTEFHTGIDFRFRRSANPGAVIGNGNFRVPPEVAANARLADVVAASSCFPSAFEPFVFPDQFAWPREFPLKTVQDALGEPFRGGLPLMDGGVYDNQGVGALVLAYARAADPPVLLICDTSPPQDRLYDQPKARGRGWFRLWMANWLAWILTGLTLASLVVLGLDAWNDRVPFFWRGLLGYGVPIFTTGLLAIALVWLRFQVETVRKLLRSDAQIHHAWKDLRGLTVPELITLVALRIASLMALTSSIFMKRVRGLIYSSVYADPRYQDRRVPNLIYNLTLERNALYGRYPWLRPGERLRELADRASEVPTALWLVGGEQLQLLVDAGEATTCFSLLKHIVSLPGERQQDPGVAALFQQLREIWDALNGPTPPPRT